MKVVAFNGSARKDGNTAILIKRVFKELEQEVSRPSWSSWPARRSRLRRLLQMRRGTRQTLRSNGRYCQLVH
jgi:hypothetical protein